MFVVHFWIFFYGSILTKTPYITFLKCCTNLFPILFLWVVYNVLHSTLRGQEVNSLPALCQDSDHLLEGASQRLTGSLPFRVFLPPCGAVPTRYSTLFFLTTGLPRLVIYHLRNHGYKLAPDCTEISCCGRLYGL